MVKRARLSIQSTQGKFLNHRYHNFVAFKEKKSPEQIKKLLETCDRCPIDLAEYQTSLKDWLKTYQRYLGLYTDGTLFRENQYATLKQIQKNIYSSPLDYQDIYFEIGNRIKAAEEIKSDLLDIMQEVKTKNQNLTGGTGISIRHRVKMSRLLIDLNHWKRNCQLKGVEEIERAFKAVQNSRKCIAKIKTMLKDESLFPTEKPVVWPESLQEVQKIRKQIVVDMEEEEAEISVTIFDKNLQLILSKYKQISYDQFESMMVEFRKRVKEHAPKILIKKFRDLKERVKNCASIISYCPTKAMLENEARL